MTSTKQHNARSRGPAGDGMLSAPFTTLLPPGFFPTPVTIPDLAYVLGPEFKKQRHFPGLSEFRSKVAKLRAPLTLAQAAWMVDRSANWEIISWELVPPGPESPSQRVSQQTSTEVVESLLAAVVATPTLRVHLTIRLAPILVTLPRETSPSRGTSPLTSLAEKLRNSRLVEIWTMGDLFDTLRAWNRDYLQYLQLLAGSKLATSREAARERLKDELVEAAVSQIKAQKLALPHPEEVQGQRLSDVLKLIGWSTRRDPLMLLDLWRHVVAPVMADALFKTLVKQKFGKSEANTAKLLAKLRDERSKITSKIALLKWDLPS